MKRYAPLAAAALFVALVLGAHAAITALQWGVDRTTSPWTTCIYDSNNVCQGAFTIPVTGGGVLLPASRGGTGVNNGSSTITLAGNITTAGAFTTSGAFPFTATLTGPTNVTFPTSGTLLTTAASVTSVSNSDGTLTISPTTGAVVASLNAPTTGRIGGVEAINSTSHQWIAYIDTSGVPHQSQPTFSDIGGSLPTLTFGTHLASGAASYNGTSIATLTSDATSANTASTIVARDGSGNFSAGTVTAALTGHSSLDCALTGCTYSGPVIFPDGSTYSSTGLANLLSESIAAGTLTTEGQAMFLTATEPASPVSTFNAVHWQVTSNGSAAQAQRAARFDLLAGYTGNNLTAVLSGANSAAGTANTLIPAAGSITYLGNVGVTSSATATTPGLNVGTAGHASAGSTNVGVLGLAQIATNSATNIGVVGTAVNTGTSPVQIGGWFSLNQTVTPTVSAALIADNGAQSSPIFLARSNGATKLTIASNGFIGAGTETNPQAPAIISLNAATGLTQPGGTIISEIAADGTSAVHAFQAFTNTSGGGTAASGAFAFQTANGTGASPTALGSGSTVGVIGFAPYNGSAFPTPRARVVGVTTEAQAPSTEGTALELDTTLAGGNVRAQAAYLASGLFVGPTATDPGAGAILANTSILAKGSTGGVGYTTGAGGTVTQLTSRTTGVTINTVTGAITLFSAAGSATPASFTVTDSAVGAADTIVVNEKSGTDLYEIFVTAVAAGSFKITFFTTGGTTTEQPVFNFSVVKGSAS